MIDTEKYEGHTPMKEWGNIVYADGYLSIFINNDYMERRVYATDLDRQLMADAPLLLAEVKQLTEFRDKVLAAFVEMPHNKRSLTYLLNGFGYLNHYSRGDYLEGLHPHALGLYELKDEWMEKAQQYLESEEE
tara:strand:- start:1674 stop:2072 length:399 start_codon:yes stop_codon:yes gene_type:complete